MLKNPDKVLGKNVLATVLATIEEFAK